MATNNVALKQFSNHVLFTLSRFKSFAQRVHRRLLRLLHEWLAPNSIQLYTANCVIQDSCIDIYGQYTKRNDFALNVIAEGRLIPGITTRLSPDRTDFVVSVPRSLIPLDGRLAFNLDSRRVYKQTQLVDPLMDRLSPVDCMMTTMAKNEETRIVEWVRWNLALGFDKVVVFLNNSTDSTRAVLEAMNDRRVVIVPFDYHAFPGRHWADVQRIQLSLAGRVAQRFSRWVAFLDVDEFILLRSQEQLTRPCIKEFLEGFARRFPEASAVRMQSFFYTNAREDYVPSQDVIENCRLRSVTPNLRYAKFIARSGQLDDFISSPHVRPADVVADPQELAIAHYWPRTSLYSHNFPGDLPNDFVTNDDVVHQRRKM